MPEETSGTEKDLPVEPLDRISPSQYSWLRKCSLRGIWSKTSSSLLPVSPKARVGTVVHQVIEEVSNGELDPREDDHFRKRWDSLVEEKEREMSSSGLNQQFVPLSSSVPKLEVIYYQTLHRARELHQKKKKSTGSGAVSAEKWVESSNGTAGGFIDRVLDTGESIILLDYKSGSLYSSASDGESGGKLKDRYEVQMKLYAALYHDMHGIWPEKLELVALDGTTEQVSYMAEKSKKLLEEASELLHSINERVLQIQNGELRPSALAQPSSETCSFCDFRPACQSYWDRRQDTTSENWPCDLAGRIADYEIGPDEEFTLRLLTSPGNAEKVVHKIGPGMVQESGANDLAESDQVELYNLYQESTKVYRSTSYTAVYPQ